MIRKYEDKDIEYIVSLGKNLHQNFKFHLDTFSNCLVYEFENKIIGFIIYSIIYERAEIVDIIIEDSFRRKKFGFKLLNKVIDECLENNCINITLEVNENNQAALDFYYNVGFKIVARINHYYSNGQEDAYLMEKKLR